MADELETQAQAATDADPTATEATPVTEAPAAEPEPSTSTEPAAINALDLDGLDARAYAEMEKRFLSGELKIEEPAEAKAPEPEKTEPETETDTEETGPKRIRLTDYDARQREAILLVRDRKAEGETISLAEAERRVAILHGEDPNHTATPKQEPTQQQAPKPQLSDMEARLAELREEVKKAAAEVDTVKMLELQEQIDATREQIATERAEAARREQAEQAELEAENQRLRKRYPDFSKQDSKLSQKWKEIHARLEAENHPILLGKPAEASRYITLLAVDELGIAPATAEPAKAPASTPSTPARKQPPAFPASGALRAATPASNTGQIEAAIAGAKSLRELEKLEEMILGAS